MKKIITIRQTFSMICFFIALLCFIVMSVAACCPVPPAITHACLITATICACAMNLLGGFESYSFTKRCYKICLCLTGCCVFAYIVLFGIFLHSGQENFNTIAKVLLFWAILSALFTFVGYTRLKMLRNKQKKY